MSPAHALRSRPAVAALSALTLALSASCGGGGGAAPSTIDGCPEAGLSGAGIQCLPPAQFAGNALTVTVPALSASERLAVILVNAGGTDRQTPTVTVTGTGAAPARISTPAPSLAMIEASDQAAARAERARGIRAAHEEFRRLDAARLAALPPEPVSLAAAAPAAVPAAVDDTRSFCHAHYLLDASQRPQIVMQKATATLRAISPGNKAQLWVTDEVWAGFLDTLGDPPVVDPQNPPPHPNTDAFLASLGAAYDGPVTTALSTYFGAQSDYDANGQMMFLFADLGSIGSAFPVGYFTSGDLRSRDATCLGSASNGADVLFLTDPATFVSKGFDVAGIRDVEYPGTMAHELQHNVNYNERCLLTRVSSGCSSGTSDDSWVNEGLSMVSEDAAGYGLATDLSNSEFVRVGSYLREYRDYALSRWESGDPIGNYGGVHAFMRYWLDQEGSAFTRQVVTSGKVGKVGVESVLGIPLASAMLRWTKAMVFSGETFSPLPALDYDAAANWAPLHLTLKYVGTSGASTVLKDAYVDYTPLPVAGAAYPSVRTDGWSAYLTGPGTGGAATVTVSTAAALKPHVLVVKFAGDLPR